MIIILIRDQKKKEIPSLKLISSIKKFISIPLVKSLINIKHHLSVVATFPKMSFKYMIFFCIGMRGDIFVLSHPLLTMKTTK